MSVCCQQNKFNMTLVFNVIGKSNHNLKVFKFKGHKMELKCTVQNYEWGKKGSESIVANLFKSSNNENIINESIPYAELWMGTHVNGPSVIKRNNQLLSNFVEENPTLLGDKVIDKFGQQLPFLFKVLSVDKALSIQAHPAKKHAEELHATFPNIYKDPNHKPELAIALTPFEALCGFRPIEEIKLFMRDIPELRRITKWETIQNQSDNEILKDGFRNVLTCDTNIISTEITNLLNRHRSLNEDDKEQELGNLVQRLNSQYPNDVGIFVVYFLNYLQLQPSQALYLGANVPHAYLSGDCIECMACSDNVVRAGLTPKFIDVTTLCSMLKYEGQTAEETIFAPFVEDACSKIYRPPVEDFAVAEIKVPINVTKYTIPLRESASIMLVVQGTGNTIDGILLEKGTVLFIPAGQALEVVSCNNELVLYQALTNV